MKNKSLRRKSGQGMTEYIIIVAVIAIGAILIVALFGQQIKVTFARITGTLGGKDTQGAGASQVMTKSGQEAVQKESMDAFDKKANN
ncbi:MAG: hypothetical protein K8T26_09245 [Lentisphaerae bacterium]|nr:hypothetical protein [Lentisphaerota bacterium]